MKNLFEVRGDTTAILIRYKGQMFEALIDTHDLPNVARMPNTWSLQPTPTTFYVKSVLNKRPIYLHRWVTSCPEGYVVDHINHDCLNNRSSNLRVVESYQNSQNRKSASSNNLSCGVLNVLWDKQANRWKVYIKQKKKYVYRKYFDTFEEAKMAAVKARAKYLPFSQESLSNIDFSDLPDKGVANINNMSSGIKNVYLTKSTGKWRATIFKDKKTTHLGYFDDKEDAIAAVKHARTR